MESVYWFTSQKINQIDIDWQAKEDILDVLENRQKNHHAIGVKL